MIKIKQKKRLSCRKLYKRLTEKIKQDEIENDDYEILIHALSNHGGLTYTNLYFYLKFIARDEKMIKRVKNTVLDSFPGSLALHVLIGAAIANKPGFWIENLLRYGPPSLIFGIGGALFYAYGKSALLTYTTRLSILFLLSEVGTAIASTIYLNRVAVAFPYANSLFIFSTTDHLISHTDIRHAIAKRQKFLSNRKGENVIQHKCFLDSAHVAHHRKHPEEYETKVKKFLFTEN